LTLVLLQAGDRTGAMAAAQEMLGRYPDQVVKNRSNDPALRPALADLEALVGNGYMQDGKLDQAQAAAGRALALYAQSLRARALQRQLDLRR